MPFRSDGPDPSGSPVRPPNEAINHGSASSGTGPTDRLLAMVYDELRELARRELAREPRGHTLQPTALVHEVYLKLVPQDRTPVHDSKHFFALAATAMRRILIDHARTKLRDKRGGGRGRVDLNALSAALDAPASTDSARLIALDEALRRLADLDGRQARVVELRHFAGLTIERTAEVLDISVATAKRDWTLARIWLYRELSGELPRDE